MNKKILIIGFLFLTLALPVHADGGEAELVLRPVCPGATATSLEPCVQPAAAVSDPSKIQIDRAVGSFTGGQEVDVAVVLKNPAQQKVISARAWLSYDPAQLEGVSINTTDSPFTLVAPGEDGFDAALGQVKIGRSNISGGVSAPEVKIATVRFKVKAAQPVGALLAFYDYQVSELGHTSVNIIDNGFPLNILSKPPRSLQLDLNGGGQASPTGGSGAVTPTQNPSSGGIPTALLLTNQGGIGGSQELVPMANLKRPSHVQIGTGDTYVFLKWNRSQERDLKGYQIYYGRTSGSYTRRRDVGLTGSARIDGFAKGETYYFALTAYDRQGRESDYSDEVAVIIGEPVSATSPLGNVLARVPNQPQNGPLMGWVLFSAAGLSATILFGRKNLNH